MGIRISEMEEAASFGADDFVPIVSNGSNKKALGSKLKAFFKGGFTAARAVVTDADGNLSESNVTSAELSNLSGIDRNINGYLTNKAFPTGGVVDDMHASTTLAQDYNGIYWVQKTQWSDMPQGSYGFLEVEGGMQRFTPYGTSGTSFVFVRMYINSTWTPWKMINEQLHEYKEASSSANVDTATYTTICSLSNLSAGKWIVSYRAAFNANSIGIRRCFLSDSNTSTTGSYDSRITYDNTGSSYACDIANSTIVELTATTTLYLRAFQNSGATIPTGGQIKAIRIV